MKDSEARGAIVIVMVFAVAIAVMFAAFIGDIRWRTGHLETDVRTLEAKLRHTAPQPKPSCKVNGQTVICHIPGKR